MINKVESLQEEIKNIQNDCNHSFIKITYPVIEPSLIPNVCIGLHKSDSVAKQTTFKIKCQKCSIIKEHDAASICPNCFNALKQDEMLQDRKKYFSREYLYYAVRISHCYHCNFHIANDEWDQ